MSFKRYNTTVAPDRPRLAEAFSFSDNDIPNDVASRHRQPLQSPAGDSRFISDSERRGHNERSVRVPNIGDGTPAYPQQGIGNLLKLKSSGSFPLPGDNSGAFSTKANAMYESNESGFSSADKNLRGFTATSHRSRGEFSQTSSKIRQIDGTLEHKYLGLENAEDKQMSLDKRFQQFSKDGRPNKNNVGTGNAAIEMQVLQKNPAPHYCSYYYKDGRSGTDTFQQKRLWRRANYEFPPPLKIKDRFQKEKIALDRTEDYSIFAVHNHYSRPTREFEWYKGESCRHLREGSEIPPGAVRYFVNSNALPATAKEPFVFANPPRELFLHSVELEARHAFPGEHQHLWKLHGDSVWRRGRRYVPRFRSQTSSLEDQREMDEMERIIWFDPEPRLERSYRLVADPKICSKGAKVGNIKDLLRMGW